MLLVRTDILEGGLKKSQVFVFSIYIHSTVQTTFHKVGKEFYSECLSASKLNILKLSIFVITCYFLFIDRLNAIEDEKDVEKNSKTRELVPDRKKIARMKERRACVILGKSLILRYLVRCGPRLVAHTRLVNL